jgi:hypothetical protein
MFRSRKPQEGTPKLLGRNRSRWNLFPGVKGVEPWSQTIHRKKYEIALCMKRWIIGKPVVYGEGSGISDLNQMGSVSF